MDGASGLNGSNGFPAGLDTWSQQVEYRDIKAQQQLTKQHYGSPMGSPTHSQPEVIGGDEVKACLTGLGRNQELEKLSRDYQPDIQGAFIGDIKSSKALEVEYAAADPIFVRKTVALSPKYPFYRSVLGDGNCGWRAMAFGYFEILLKTGDPNRIGMEFARIVSLNNLMSMAGMEPYIFEDFVDATITLFNRISASPVIDRPYDVSPVMDAFNDTELSNAIITHFKFLTSSWMKSRPDYYAPFLDQSVKAYCESQVEPYGIEIDHVGLMALIDCLILPASLAVEVFYLDRSPGDEVNVHRFQDVETEGMMTPADAPVLRLLYRPGHYDILYKDGEIATAPPPPPPLQVSFLSSLPEQAFAPTPLAYFPQMSSSDMNFLTEPGPSNFRPSMFNLPAFQPSPLQSLPFQTTTFRNSPFNPSHFQSENFQPEIYQPPTSTSNSSSKRSSSVEKRTSNSSPRSESWDSNGQQYLCDDYSTGSGLGQSYS